MLARVAVLVVLLQAVLVMHVVTLWAGNNFPLIARFKAVKPIFHKYIRIENLAAYTNLLQHSWAEGRGRPRWL